jgi:hypothetical protein
MLIVAMMVMVMVMMVMMMMMAIMIRIIDNWEYFDDPADERIR